MNITGRELTAARMLTGFSQRHFAARAGVNPDTINRLETAGAGYPKAKPATLDRILTCLGQYGVAIAPGGIIHTKR